MRETQTHGITTKIGGETRRINLRFFNKINIKKRELEEGKPRILWPPEKIEEWQHYPDKPGEEFFPFQATFNLNWYHGGEKPNPVLIARFIQLQNSKNNRIRYDKRNTACLTARSCRRLSKLKNRQGALSKRLFVFSPNLITDCIKKSWTITRIIALHKSFCEVFGHFSNTCPLASNLSFDQPRPEILHGYLVFF